MSFKGNLALQQIITQEWADGKTLGEIILAHPEHSVATYKRFLRGKPHPAVWTEERRAKMAEAQKINWNERDLELKAKHIEHLRQLAESQKGKTLVLSDDHVRKIQSHLASPEMKEIRERWNRRGKKPKTERKLKGKDQYANTMSAKARLEELGLTVVCLGGNRVKISYGGKSWNQYWCGSPNATTRRMMRKIDQAEAIQSAIQSGSSLTAACKANGVDPVTMARHLKFSGTFYEAVASIRSYEKILEVAGAEYNKRLDGLMVRPDIQIQDKRLIVEVDGLHWHTEDKKDKRYHYERACLYEALGYNLLVFSQNEVENKRDIVDSMMENKLGKIPNRIGARECTAACLLEKGANEFFGQNHLKGKGDGKTMALIHDGEVVCALRYQDVGGEIHVSRFCCRTHWSVTGGYSRLLSMLDTTKRIVNFVDRRHGNGKHLIQLGFIKENEHIGFEWTNGYEAFNRRMFPGGSGTEHGMKRYWDYGQIKWTREPPQD